MSKLDPSIERALRAARGREYDETRLGAFASRINTAAEPLLRELRTAPPAWWDLPASWSRMLIPAGLVVAMASLLLLLATPAKPDRRSEIAMVSAVRHSPSDEMVDQVLHDLVIPPPRAAGTPR